MTALPDDALDRERGGEADGGLDALVAENERLRRGIRAALMLNSPRQKDKTLRRALGEVDKC